MARKISLYQLRINDLTECTICLSTFKQPKSLPCLHTFCLGCLDTCVERSGNLKKISCPLCREKSVIPAGGLKRLRDNFIVKSISELKVPTEVNLMSSERILCDACAEIDDSNWDDAGDESDCRRSEAVKYCFECDKKLCNACVQKHKQVVQLKQHTLTFLKLVYVNKIEECSTLPKGPHNPCSKHPDNELRIYCCVCETVVECVICLTQNHNGHIFEEISTTSARMKDTISAKSSDIDAVMSEVDTLQQNFKKLENDIVNRAESVNSAIRNRCSEYKAMIDLLEVELLQESQGHKDVCLSKYRELMRNVESKRTSLNSCKHRLGEIISKKSDFEVAMIAEEFRSSLEQELITVKQDLGMNLEEEICHPEFCSTGLSVDKNILGFFIPKYFGTGTDERIDDLSYPVPPPFTPVQAPVLISSCPPSGLIVASAVPVLVPSGSSSACGPVSYPEPTAPQQVINGPTSSIGAVYSDCMPALEHNFMCEPEINPSLTSLRPLANIEGRESSDTTQRAVNSGNQPSSIVSTVISPQPLTVYYLDVPTSANSVSAIEQSIEASSGKLSSSTSANNVCSLTQSLTVHPGDLSTSSSVISMHSLQCENPPSSTNIVCTPRQSLPIYPGNLPLSTNSDSVQKEPLTVNPRNLSSSTNCAVILSQTTALNPRNQLSSTNSVCAPAQLLAIYSGELLSSANGAVIPTQPKAVYSGDLLSSVKSVSAPTQPRAAHSVNILPSINSAFTPTQPRAPHSENFQSSTNLLIAKNFGKPLERDSTYTSTKSATVNSKNNHSSMDRSLAVDTGTGVQKPLAENYLARFLPPEQKIILVQRLYLLVCEINPKLASEITHMLLNLCYSDLLLLLQSRSALADKVKETIAVLPLSSFRK